MKGLVALLLSIGLAMLSWGTYGPILREGQLGMHGSALRPFICVGLAYFLIAVLLPVGFMRVTGEKGHWTTSGIIWSLVAGGVGALGALGVILAMAFHGSPVYVMPLVFGCAPVVNTFLTMYWSKSFKQLNPVFVAGLILVIVGAVTVLVFRPSSHGSPPKAEPHAVADGEAPAASPAPAEMADSHFNWLYVMAFTAMTALSWGVYGPTLHRGQTAMAGSRLRPFICVGLAYFLVAVIVPVLLLTAWHEPGEFTPSGTLWSLAGGTAGAAGARLGIILAFTFGGKPIFVMPLVFGGAPVINTFVSLMQMHGDYDLHPMFYAGLIIVAAGAVTVLVFAPRPDHHPPAEPETKPAPEAASR